jgi:hypothetical protein
VAASSRTLRPGLVLAAGLLLAAAGPVPLDWAQDHPSEISVELHTFQDSRGVTVVSPTLELSRDFTDRTALRARFGVDTISAASDSCVRCLGQGVLSARAFAGASVVRKLGSTSLSLGGEFSQESFYRSTTILASVARTLNKQNTTVAGGFSFSLNQPVLHPREATRNQTAQNAYVSVTQTLSKSTVLQGGYELGHVGGYQTNPFLRPLVNGVRILGNSPDRRTRHTLTLRLRQALTAGTFLEADYRHYLDDWKVRSDSLSFGLSRQFSPRFLQNVTYRRYRQTGASFYAPEYLGTPEFFTADFRLQPFASNLFTGRSVFTPKGGFAFLPPRTALTLQYEWYTSDIDFRALILTAGVRIPLGGPPRSP